MDSQIRQNYHRDCEAAVNRMANMELHASYVYLSMVGGLGTPGPGVGAPRFLHPKIPSVPPGCWRGGRNPRNLGRGGSWGIPLTSFPSPLSRRGFTSTGTTWPCRGCPGFSWSSRGRSGNTPRGSCACRRAAGAAFSCRTSRFGGMRFWRAAGPGVPGLLVPRVDLGVLKAGRGAMEPLNGAKMDFGCAAQD